MTVARSARILAALAILANPALAETPRSIIVMDGSGSMWGQIDGRAKLEIARETVATVLGGIPAEQELGLMAYGHREKGNCSDIELIVPPAPGTGTEIAAQVAKMRFLGKTPLSESVRQAAEALRYDERAATVVLVTDGLETCDADPCALGRELEAAGLNFTAHVIGFGLSGAQGAAVACLATETGGQYLQASDSRGLADALAATVTAKLPPPQPAPVPEPELVLPTASLTLPETAPAGSLLRIKLTGPHEEYDYIRILDASGEWLAEAVVEDAPFVDLRLPFKTGLHEVVYLFNANEIIARAPITLTEAPVSIAAPERAQVGSVVTVTWVGPDAHLDNIQLWNADTGERWGYEYTKDKTSIDWTIPDAPGNYEFRYAFLDNETIHTRPIIVTLEEVEAATAPGLVIVPVSLSVPVEYAGQPILWSATPLDPHPDAPEALALPEPVTGPWQAELYPGRWRIYGEAPVGVTTGQGFGADITVTTEPGQAFEIPLTPMETTGMGEDPPLGDVVAVTIRAEGYDGLVEWSAMPDGGTPDDRLADTVANGWQTKLTPGKWAVFGMAGDATFFGRIDIVAGQTDYVIPREGATDDAAQIADDVVYRCDIAPACPFTDTQTGLGFALPVGWITDVPYFYETAAGVRSDLPTMAFMTAAGDRIELNPVRWSVENGPCLSTAAGELCHWADASAGVVAAHSALAPSLTLDRTSANHPAIPGIKLDLTPKAASALRAKLLGEN